MQTLGVPYAANYDQQAVADLKIQAKKISDDLAKDKINVSEDKKIIALIAYLQRLGTDIKASK